MLLINIIHDGHAMRKAFNTQCGIPQTVIYCATCAGEFHGCYCDLENCANCEALETLEV